MLTLSAIKADVGSIGDHSRPSSRMLRAAEAELEKAISKGLLIEGAAEGRRDAPPGVRGAGDAAHQELEYSAFRTSPAQLEEEFRIVEKPAPSYAPAGGS